MAQITLKGNPVRTCGELPAVGSTAPDFSMVKGDLSEAKLSEIQGIKILNVFPSIDTPTCATSVRVFNQKAAALSGTTVLNLSKDLVFAQKRFCGAEGIDKAETASVFNSEFSKSYGLEIADGPLKGLCSRAVLVLAADNKVLHAQQVSEIADEPDYDAALASIV
jgi:thiol peroxidase